MVNFKKVNITKNIRFIKIDDKSGCQHKSAFSVKLTIT